MAKMKMTTEEAFVKVLQMHGIEHAFGIIGSAFMPISDLFPKAGITFWDCAHEGSGGMMADGFTRASGKMSMMIAQNGPGITNFVTAGENRLLEPHAAAAGHAAGGQQDHRPGRLPGSPADGAVQGHGRLQEEVRRSIARGRGAQPCHHESKARSAPAQINMPRDFWTQVIDIELPAIVDFERPSGGEEAIARAAKLLSEARFPVILKGAAWCSAARSRPRRRWPSGSTRRSAAATSTMTPSPASHPLFAGPLGYNGSKAAMELIAKADVVLALGTRLNPFSTLPGYGLDYWPTNAASSRSTSTPTASASPRK